MKALVYERPGRTYGKICEVPYPVCGDDEVIIKVMSAAICKGVEQSHDNNLRPDIKGYPVIPGHEFAGYVVETGKHVEGIQIGERVTANSIESCGACFYCKNGQPEYCVDSIAYGNNVNGGFAEYVKVHKKCIFQIPDSMSFNEGTLIEPVSCCMNAVERAEIQYGDTVIILGTGPMGLILGQLVNRSHAGNVYLASRKSKKLEMAEKLQIKTISLEQNTGESLIANIKKVEKYGVDVIIDTTGSPSLCKSAMKCLKKGGKLIQYGFVHSGEPLMFDSALMFNNELTFKTSFAFPVSYCRAIDAVKHGVVNVKILVSGEYKLEDYFIGLDKCIEDRDTIKIMIHPNEE